MKFWFNHSLLLLLALGSCSGSYYMGSSSFKKYFMWERTDGTVVDYKMKNKRPYKHAVIRFSSEGKEYTVTSQLIDSDDVPFRNQTVRIMYPKDHPEEAEAKSLGFHWGIPALLAVIGLFVLLVINTNVRRKLRGEAPPKPEDMKSHPKVQELKDFLEQRKWEK
jgi:hypothetical protein